MRNEKLDLIPVVDEEHKVINYITWANSSGVKKSKKKHLDVPVVIMAGGKGSRMEPFTKVLPKPLIPVHDKTIIEHIIERFTDVGCLEFYLTVNYKSKILKAYFEELQPKYNVSFVDEMIPLGECFMSPGILQEKMFFFIARGLTLGEPALEDDEQIENQIVTREEAIAMVIDGRICDAKTMVGLLLFDRLKVY